MKISPRIFLGDSIQNILGDVLSCAIGYILGTVFLAVELWWLSLVWIVVSEVITITRSMTTYMFPMLQVVCLLYMRDSLLLAILTTLVHSQRLRQWQCAKIPQAKGNYFLSRLSWLSSYRTKAC